MPETSSNGDTRIAVYVCYCGGNISDVVDCEAVAAALRGLPDVVVSRTDMSMCSDAGQALIESDIASAQAGDRDAWAQLVHRHVLPVQILRHDLVVEVREALQHHRPAEAVQGVQAALWGSVLVAIFMLIYYRGSGVVTDIALISNILILMAVLVLLLALGTDLYWPWYAAVGATSTLIAGATIQFVLQRKRSAVR